MRRLTGMLVVVLLSLIFVGVAQGVVDFSFGQGFYVFPTDQRVTGQERTSAVLFDLGKMKAGYLNSQGYYTFTSEKFSDYTFGAEVSIVGFRILRELVPAKGAVSSYLGLDLGSATIVGVPESVYPPWSLNQVIPFTSLLGIVTYEAKSERINSELRVLAGYRFLDIRDVVFELEWWEYEIFKTLNTWILGLEVVISF